MTERADPRPLSNRDRALLVRLADGALTGRPRAHAEARLREIPDGDRLVERQRRVTRALRAGASAQLTPPVDARETTTVFYEHYGHRIAYTIVSGAPLPPPAAARVVRRDGLEIAVYHDARHGGHDVAVFERDGRTCVLAGHVEEQSTLLELAAWKGGGTIRA